jgi:hypothetical protein
VDFKNPAASLANPQEVIPIPSKSLPFIRTMPSTLSLLVAVQLAVSVLLATCYDSTDHIARLEFVR